MCPPIPGLAFLHIDITSSWSDEELVRFLAERKIGDSLPGNVLEVDGMTLYQIDPRKNHDDYCPYGIDDNAIRNTEDGYWKPVNTFRIQTSTGIVGVKIRLEFYEGQPPSGKRTGLVMNEYKVSNIEANVPKEYRSLCTILLDNDRINAEDRQISLDANVSNDHTESYFNYLAEIEKQRSTANIKLIASNQQNFSSNTGQYEHKTHNDADAAFHHDLANEGFIELNDLLCSENDLCSEGSASTLEYSSRHCMVSEEYLDSDALLRQNFNDSKKTDEEADDCKFSIPTPISKTDHVVTSPPEQDAIAFHPRANEAYIELNDLLTPEASASTSERSSGRSMISEESNDLDSILSGVSNDRDKTDAEPENCKFSIAASTKLDHVIISPAEQGRVHSHHNNDTVSRTSVEKSLPDGARGQYSNECLPQDPSTASCLPISHVKRRHSNSSNSSSGSSTKSSQRDPAMGKFRKIGKKYCCFGPF